MVGARVNIKSRLISGHKKRLAFLAFAIAAIITLAPIILEIPPISYKFRNETLLLIWLIAVAVALCLSLAGLLLLRVSGYLPKPFRYPSNLFVTVVAIIGVGLAGVAWSYQWYLHCPHIGPSCFSSFMVCGGVFVLNMIAAVLSGVGIYELWRVPPQVIGPQSNP